MNNLINKASRSALFLGSLPLSFYLVLAVVASGAVTLNVAGVLIALGLGAILYFATKTINDRS